MEFNVPESKLKKIENFLTDTNLLKKFQNARVKAIESKKNEFQDIVCTLDLSENEIENLIDILMDYLTSFGFTDDDEINDVGRDIESIIDLFNYYER